MDQSIPIEGLIHSGAVLSRRTERGSAFTLIELLVVIAIWFAGGCFKSSVDRALASDARGYFCPGCKTKFYTEFDVIADV